MKLTRSMVVAIMVIAIFTGTAFSQKLTPGMKGAMKLLEMKQKGWIEIQVGDPNTLIFVEPKVWGAMQHRQKYQMVKWGLDYCQESNKRDYTTILKLIFLDMTSHNELASAWVSGPAANRIDISK